MKLANVPDLPKTFDRIEIEGKTVWLPRPTPVPAVPTVRRDELLHEVLPAFLAAGGPALNPRLVGPPGTGKNTLAYEISRQLGQDIYVLDGTSELTALEVTCTAAVGHEQRIDYVASPLFAAMLRGGLCFFDELGKVPPAALSPLAAALDERRTLNAWLPGITFTAHPEFRFCAALNEHEELPESIEERTRPEIFIGYPERAMLMDIVRTRVAQAEDVWFEAFHHEAQGGDFSPRAAVIALSYAWRLASYRGTTDLALDSARKYVRRGLDAARDRKAEVS